MSLKVNNIEKHYTIAGHKRIILKTINLAVKKGEIISITGKSGCGKTTLLNVISGITKPDNGTIHINDKKINYHFDFLTSRQRNNNIGFIFQTFKLLFDETVFSNVLLPARLKGKVNAEIKDYACEVLSKLKIYKYRNSIAGILSGGQKQRVAIARALINKPSIILADEPTANLDKQTSIQIFDTLEELKDEGKAILIITHKDYMHERSDIVYSMHEGELQQI